MKNVKKAIELMLADQGLPADSPALKVPNTIDGKPADWACVDRLLGQLTEEQLVTLCIGEQEEAAVVLHTMFMIEDADYVHRALDELFMLIGG